MHKACQTSVQRVLSSATFKKKEVLKSLLEYFLDSTIENKLISERSIAKDVFHRKDFDGSEDTIVRVNLFKLRQLLQRYYLKEGKNDKFRIEIPRGTYVLECVSLKSTTTISKRDRKFTSLYVVIGVLCAGWIATILLFQNDNSETDNPVWGSFKNERPTKIILCSPYFNKFVHKSSSRELIVRDFSINSKSEIDSTLKNIFPDSKFGTMDMEFSYFMPSNIYSLPTILRSLFLSDVDQIELFSLEEFNNKEISNNNIVFIGSLKSLGYLNLLFENTSVKIEREPLHMVLNDSINLHPIDFPAGRYTDYALIVKTLGEGGNNIFIVTAMYTPGIEGILNKLEEKDFLEGITKEYNGFPEKFEMIVKVSGINYSNLDAELVHFKKLN